MAFKNVPNRINFFIHPLPLAAVLIMALNDHLLKYHFPGIITGKLSDFSGVFYLPIFLLALITTIDEALGLKRFNISSSWALGAILFKDLLMFLVKLSPSSCRVIEGFFDNHIFPIYLTPDPTDLVSVIVNPLTYFHLRSYWTSSKKTSQRKNPFSEQV